MTAAGYHVPREEFWDAHTEQRYVLTIPASAHSEQVRISGIEIISVYVVICEGGCLVALMFTSC